jgi:flavin reductase (DIM6/NTAB) family NADH-FMN oxidoreductase RutF
MKQKEAVPADGGWIEKNIREFPGSPGSRIGDGWMLISAGTAQDWNTMTASWGGLGVLWSRDVAFMFIRPSRHTFGFANDNPLFTLSFFEPRYREALSFCGASSGRDADKAARAGLTPVEFSGGGIAFKEASEVIICRKLYTHDFDPRLFLDPPSVEKAYNGRDYHRMYIGEILSLRVRA